MTVLGHGTGAACLHYLMTSDALPHGDYDDGDDGDDGDYLLMLFILFTAATEHHLTLFCHTLPCLAIPARTLKGYTSQDFERIYQPGH